MTSGWLLPKKASTTDLSSTRGTCRDTHPKQLMTKDIKSRHFMRLERHDSMSHHVQDENPSTLELSSPLPVKMIPALRPVRGRGFWGNQTADPGKASFWESLRPCLEKFGDLSRREGEKQFVVLPVAEGLMDRGPTAFWDAVEVYLESTTARLSEAR